MNTFESAFENVSELANIFKANYRSYISPEYQEAEVRKDFIDKFFLALGWDVDHNFQLNPYEQEVKVEKRQIQKRADYAFYIAPNYKDVRFFVEAKKPARNIYNPADYFQACIYGWNANNPIVILTNFEELHILDSRFKPNISTILENQIKKYSYLDYLNKDKFAEVYFLLNRDEVALDSVYKYGDNLPKPRGKAIQKGLFKGGYQSIDDAFLEELDEMRESLARSFKKNNPELDSDALTEITQRTIDRLVFIRFLEDKLIEPDYYISEMGDSHSAWSDFIRLSKKLDAKYNGVVFKKHLIDSRNFAEPESIVFSSICENISHINSPYNFDIIPIHILGSIYERFLGKVIHATDKRVKIELKPELRKQEGVYYTPQYIVKYIVDNTLDKLISGKTPKEISSIRIIDIACGSGSFLISVFEHILSYHKVWYQNNPQQAKKDGCIFLDGIWTLSLIQKQKILVNNIFGVDVDPQAIEVTQLSLYLKLLEDETTATANDMSVLFKEKLLPSLSQNIICGNSIIEADIIEDSFFSYEDEINIKPLNLRSEFPHIFAKGGFDLIIGNPPWVDIKGLDHDQVDYYFKKYKTSENRINLYALFIEKCSYIINSKGMIGYIIPNSLLYQSSYSKLRKLILEQFTVNKIIKLPDDVFKNVKAESIIVILSKQKNNHNTDCMIYDRDKKINIISNKEASEVKKIDIRKWINNESFVFDIYSNQEIVSLLRKIERLSKPLEYYCEFSLGITPYDKYKGHSIKDIQDKIYHSSTQKDKTFKKLLNGGDVKRYFVEWEGDNYISYGSWLGAPREKRFFFNERILVRQIVSGNPLRIYAALTQEELYNTQSIFNLLLREYADISINYVVAILNSKLMNYYHTYKYLDITKNTFQKILIQNCKKFPIRDKDRFASDKLAIYNEIVLFVNKIIKSKANSPSSLIESQNLYYERKCRNYDNEIDMLVYKLYDLTDNEIALIEQYY